MKSRCLTNEIQYSDSEILRCLDCDDTREMHDNVTLALQEELTEMVSTTGARGVLIDISCLDVVDSFMGRSLATITSTVRILDAEAVIIGMQPAVAITLTELGLTLPGMRTAMNLERGLEILAKNLRNGRA